MPDKPFARVPIISDAPACLERTRELADAFQLSVQTQLPASGQPYLRCTATRLELAIVDDPMRAIFTDFIGGTMGFRRARINTTSELLCKAIGRKLLAESVTVWDLTAGLGRDACIMAALGCSVIAWERAPALAALLADGCRRAADDADYARQVQARILVRYADAKTAFAALTAEATPAILYLDPMFPPRRKSAAVKKEMMVSRLIAGDDDDAGELLATARSTNCSRVIVKRPRHAPPLADAPTQIINGRTIRYDIYSR